MVSMKMVKINNKMAKQIEAQKHSKPKMAKRKMDLNNTNKLMMMKKKYKYCRHALWKRELRNLLNLLHLNHLTMWEEVYSKNTKLLCLPCFAYVFKNVKEFLLLMKLTILLPVKLSLTLLLSQNNYASWLILFGLV